MKSCPSIVVQIVLLVIYLTTTTTFLSTSYVVVLAAAATTRCRDDDNDKARSLPQQQHQQSRNSDPIRDGILYVHDVTFDFRLAFPPYNMQSLEKLLLLPPQQQKMKKKMDDWDDNTRVTAKEMAAVASEEVVVHVNNVNNILHNNKKSISESMAANNIPHVSMDDEDTTTNDQDKDNVDMVDSTALFSSPDYINDGGGGSDHDDVDKDVTANGSIVTLTLSSPLTESQLEDHYNSNVDGTPQPEQKILTVYEMRSNHMINDLLDSNDNIQSLYTMIDDDVSSYTMSSSLTNAMSHRQSVDGLDNLPPKLLFESVEILFDELDMGEDRSSTMQQVVGQEDIISNKIHSSSTITSTVSSSSTTTTSSSTNSKANRQFVDGLDDLPKLFESVEVPDELDVGADGSSMQDVLVGQGIKIIWKHVKNLGGGISHKLGWELGGSSSSSITADSVWKALPWSNYGSGSELEEEKNLSLLDSLLLNDLTTDKITSKDDRAEKTSERWVNTKLESFSLVKSLKAKKIWKYAQRKLEQTRRLLDVVVKLFEGAEDDDDDETNESFLKSRSFESSNLFIEL